MGKLKFRSTQRREEKKEIDIIEAIENDRDINDWLKSNGTWAPCHVQPGMQPVAHWGNHNLHSIVWESIMVLNTIIPLFGGGKRNKTTHRET